MFSHWFGHVDVTSCGYFCDLAKHFMLFADDGNNKYLAGLAYYYDIKDVDFVFHLAMLQVFSTVVGFW